MKEKVWYHFNKLKKDYCHCLFYSIGIKDGKKYISFHCQFEKNDIDFDSLESYNYFCILSKWDKRFRRFELNEFLKFDIDYNVVKNLHDNINNRACGQVSIRFKYLSPEEAFEYADAELNRNGYGRIYKPLYEITEDIEEGCYWSDYIIEDLKGIFDKELREYEKKQEEHYQYLLDNPCLHWALETDEEE